MNIVRLDEQKDVANSSPKLGLCKWEEYRESKNRRTVLKAVPLRKQWRLIDLMWTRRAEDVLVWIYWSKSQNVTGFGYVTLCHE